MNVNFLIWIGIIVMMLLGVCIILFVLMYQRRQITYQLELKKINEQKELELLQASIQSEEEERMRIASELHDDVQATLASARLFLYKEKDSQYDEQIINQSKELLDESINKIRNISHKLQPATLQHLGLELALQSIIETLGRSGSLSAKHRVRSVLPRTTDQAELAAYRISQELVTNIIKHARAKLLILETGANEKEIIISLMHDGAGLTQEAYEEQIYKKGAIGLKNILNRLKSVGASLKFTKTVDGNYITILSLPLNAATK